MAPTAQRQFSSTRRVTAFLRVYDPGGSGAVTMLARIVDREERTRFEQRSLLRDSNRSSNAWGDYRLYLPLSELGKGDYLLSIDASRGTRTVRRNVRFSVR